MNKLLTVPTLIFVSILFSQSKFDINNLIDRDGLKYAPNDDELYTGKVFDYYENGQKKYENTYKDGKEDGLWTKWYENGQKFREGTFKDGKQDGLWTDWYENGQKSYEVTYKDGKFNCFDGSKSIDASWVNDRECDCSDCSDEPLR